MEIYVCNGYLLMCLLLRVNTTISVLDIFGTLRRGHMSAILGIGRTLYGQINLNPGRTSGDSVLADVFLLL